MLNLVITTGLPRSGKSTYISKNFSSYRIIDIDQLRLEFSDSIYNEDLEPYVWDIARDRAISYLLQGKSVVIDESNTYIKNILFWYKIKYWVPDISVTLLAIFTPLEVCLSRTNDKILKNAIIRKSKSNMKKSDLIHLCNKYKMNFVEIK